MPANLPRVAFDARYLSHGLLGGVHTYTHNLLSTLLTLDVGYAFDIWIDDKAPFEITELPETARIFTRAYRSMASSIHSDLRIGGAMRAQGATVAHFPANVGAAVGTMPGVLTVHDAINLLPLREIIAGHPKRVGTIAKMAYLHFMSTWSVARRPLVITVSEYSKREILRQSGLNPDEIRVVPNAPDAAFRVLPLAETSALRSRYRLREYVLVADAIYNSTAVLSAYRRLDSDVRARTSLVFFSRRVPDAEIVAASDVGECVLVLQPTRDELVQLYNLADLLVFPSLYEGFGIPIVEAMKCGTPVIGSDRGAIPEVIGPGGVVVRLEDEMALADAVAALLNRPFRRRELRELALKHAARYSWHATAIATLEVYDDALRRSSVRSLYPTGERVTQ